MPEHPQTFGPNAWLVDEMYEQFRRDPTSVSESWREFFADYKPASPNGDGEKPVPAPAPTTSRPLVAESATNDTKVEAGPGEAPPAPTAATEAQPAPPLK